MKQQLEELVRTALSGLPAGLIHALPAADAVVVERTKDPQHGDFATNIALRLAKTAQRDARELAQAIVAALPASPWVARTEIAGAGFINFFLAHEAYARELATVHQLRDGYGRSNIGRSERVMVELVATGPGGPLEATQARQATYGATLSNLLDAVGYDVGRECYINDDGHQEWMLADIRDELAQLGIEFDGWYAQRDLSDHLEKQELGSSHVIAVLGADQHDYIERVRAGLIPPGTAGAHLEVKLVQSVSLTGHNEPRALTSRQLREEVGHDTCRFFYLMRGHDQPLDFDVELAKIRSTDNPAFYVQYAHARAASVRKQLTAQSLQFDRSEGLANAALLSSPQEQAALNCVARYPESLESAAVNRAPHVLVHYLRELAGILHAYHSAGKFMVADAKLRNARVALVLGIQQVLRNGLTLLGISAPESM